jgi:hypothetical protein
MVARWSVSPFGMLWPAMDAAFVTSDGGGPTARADRWSSSLKVVQSIPLDDGDIEWPDPGTGTGDPCTQRIDPPDRSARADPWWRPQDAGPV